MKFSLSSLPQAILAALAIALFPLVASAQSSLPNAQVGVAYSFQITTSPAAPAGSVYAATGLPAGLGVNASSGLISGTPSVAGVFDISLSVASGGITNVYPVRLTVSGAAAAPSITSSTAVNGTVGAAISSLTVTASNSPTSFNIGALPPGLSVGGTGTAPTITGTPTTAGTFAVSLSANNSAGTGTPVTLTFTIAPAVGTPTITSPSTANASTTAAFTFQLAATNTPTSYAAAGLPLGLSLNTTTGVISGTATVPGVYPVTVSGANAAGAGSPSTLTITVGSLSSVTSLLVASGTVGQPFSYILAGSNSPTSYNVGTLPAGLTANTTTGAISGTPTTAGVRSVTVSANNATGTGPTATIVISVAAPSSGGGGGGGGGGGFVLPPLPPIVNTGAPSITAQPASQTATAGSSVTFSVSAGGTGLTFQWLKDGTPIAGATSATLTLSNISAADAGGYSVMVRNSVDAVTSSVATLSVLPGTPSLLIATQPAAQTANRGDAVTFTVVASGGGPLTYQWFKDGTALSGATSATLTLSNVGPANAGSYHVIVTSPAGSVTSSPAALSVLVPSVAGAYFGTFGGSAGNFALYIRPDRTGAFLGFVSANRVPLIATDLVVTESGRFSATAPAAAAAASPGDVPRAAHEGEFHIEGSIAANGAVTGTVSTLNLTLSAPAPAGTGATAAAAGFYQAGAAGTSASSYAILGSAGNAFVLTTTGSSADAGTGTVDALGAISARTVANVTVTGTARGGSIDLQSGASRFAGRSSEAAAELEKLVNISTRSQSGAGGNVMIAGFVIAGGQPKSVLIRGIGPTLGSFGVAGALNAVRLEVFRGSESVAVGNDWGAANNAAAIATTSARVGAFALANNSRDSALLLTLPPAAYTVIVSGQTGATGVSLIEVYDATEGTIPNAQRIINISTRAMAGAGDNALIAGFYINGTVPKRVLIRGVGPALGAFGVTGTLARPQLTIRSDANVVAQNSGWSTSADAPAITAASAQVGAFAFAANSPDAAVILFLQPGAYSAEVAGVGGTTGLALVEVYEVP